MKFVDCTEARHAAPMLDIFNTAILTSTALYEYEPWTMATMAAWFRAKREGDHPVIGAERADGTLLGFATYGVFRARPAYRYTVEHSVYVHEDRRGVGVGRALLERLIDTAIARDVHVMVGGIDVANTGSIALHERLGFTHAGTIRQAGYKFGRWLDLAFYQRILPTPAQPTTGICTVA